MKELPLYFWNPGYSQLRKVDDFLKLSESSYICTSGLDWLLKNPYVQGIFVFEGIISPDTVTGIFPQSTKIMLSNLVYELTENSVPRFLLCLESYVELPIELAPLIPILINPLPSAITIQNFVNNCCDRIPNSIHKFETLVRTCLGLPMGELEMLFSRLLGLPHTLEELIDGVLDYKKSKLKNQADKYSTSVCNEVH
jgi:hypothetical protein